MDEILAINTRRRDGLNNTENSKRSAVEDKIINANNAEEISDDLFEGDIVLDPDTIPEDKELYDMQQKKKNETSVKTGTKRQGTRNLKWLWHYKKVPYEISSSLFQIKDTILKAIQTFNSKTCVKFVPRKANDRNYVLFDKRQGCYSRIGRSYARQGPQVISVGQYCDYEDIIIHEMLHSVGFFHEQSRPDRQNHVEIHWQNIKPGFENEFLQYGHDLIAHLQINYNYKSIMHYGSKAFSKSAELETITAIGTRGKIELGNTQMSVLDIIELDALYRCK
ncbi:partial, partial [Paramuricea clavata]